MRQRLNRGPLSLTWLASMIAAGALLWAEPAPAADCGGGIGPCKCGDTVVANTVLSGNLGPCPKGGLQVASGVVLDCARWSITGTNTRDIGIHLDPATSDAEVRNCVVTNFRQGIRIGSGKNNRIVDNEVFGNRKYAIEVAGASTGNLLQGNRVGKPNGAGVTKPDEGIHNGAGSHGTVIRQNTVIDSKAENIYVLSSNNVQVVGNTVSEVDGASIFLKNASAAYVGQNTVAGGSITVRGDSAGNVLEANVITSGKGYLFEAHRDETGDPSPGYWRYPRRNTILGGAVVKPDKIPGPNPGEEIRPCLRFEGSYKNRVDGLALDPTCTPPFGKVEGGQASSGNVIDGVLLTP